MSRKHLAYYLPVVIVLASLILTYLSQQPRYTYRRVYSGIGSLSISSDGKYIVSSHLGGEGSLWNLPAREKRKVADNVNIHSAFFINNNAFMFQDASSHEVTISTLGGEKLQSFNPQFDTYGHVLDPSLSFYLASDKQWQLHLFKSFQHEKIIKPYDNGPSIDSSGKLLDLSISKGLIVSSGEGDGDDNLTISDGSNDIAAGLTKNPHVSRSLWAGVMVWEIKTGKPIARMPGMVYKTHATISPDAKYVVAGDENGLLNVWFSSTGKRLLHGASLVAGVLIGEPMKASSYWDHKNPTLPPKDYCQPIEKEYCRSHSHINAIRFIDKTHYLRFANGIPYAILYDILNPRPLKYFHLGKDVNPDTYGYTASHRIATAPEAGILVMAQGRDRGSDINKGSGILVYKYDKKKQTLTRIWAPDGPKAHWKRFRS